MSLSAMKFKILYLFFVLIFILIATEISVRLLHLASTITNPNWNFVNDPYLPYKQRPFSIIAGRSASNEYYSEYKHNSVGIRDIEHNIVKPEGVFRILGLGDSFTYGQGAPFEDTYLYRLEKMLNAREGNHPEIEIIKAGIPRFFPELERIFLEKYGLQYKPDLILIGFLPNDVADTFMGIDAVKVNEDGYLIPKEAKKFGKTGKWLYIHSHLSRIILGKYKSFRTKINRPRFPEIYKVNGYHEKDWRKVESEYRKMIEISARANAKIAFIHIPQAIGDDSYPALRLSSFCSEQNVTFIDVLPAMQKASQYETLYWPRDGHCNSSGYRVIAEAIYEKLIENEFIP